MSEARCTRRVVTRQGSGNESAAAGACVCVGHGVGRGVHAACAYCIACCLHGAVPLRVPRRAGVLRGIVVRLKYVDVPAKSRSLACGSRPVAGCPRTAGGGGGGGGAFALFGPFLGAIAGAGDYRFAVVYAGERTPYRKTRQAAPPTIAQPAVRTGCVRPRRPGSRTPRARGTHAPRPYRTAPRAGPRATAIRI